MTRLEYTMEQYKLYHGHINNMFNYFLVLEGLIANAYVASITSEKVVSENIPFAIGIFGFLASLVLWAVHSRSRAMLDTIEGLIRKEEVEIFNGAPGFLTYDGGNGRFWQRHKYQFPIVYAGFAAAFLLSALYQKNVLIERLYACYNGA